MTTDADQSRPARAAAQDHGTGWLAVTRRGPRVTALALGLCLTAAPLLAACSSGAAHSSATAKSCTQVSATLSDGPDPDADPVGYAEAQIKPLRAISIADPALRTAVSALATAYADVYSSNNKSPTATKAVAAAAKKVNAICPGAAS